MTEILGGITTGDITDITDITEENTDDGAESGAPTRRAPYADRPTVGTRGLRTQQRILDAALEVFAEVGYDRATVEHVGKVAGCSRVSIYQYFTGKDDLFRHLARQVARQLRSSMEMIAPVTADAAGVTALKDWILSRAAVHARYAPVFRAFDAAAASDEALQRGAIVTTERNVSIFLARLGETTVPPRQLEPLVELLLSAVTRAIDVGAVLEPALPEQYARENVAGSIAATAHRALFGVIPGVNLPVPTLVRAPAIAMTSTLEATFEQARSLQAESAEPGRQALAAMLGAAAPVIVGRGFKGIRVDDIVEAAGVSHRRVLPLLHRRRRLRTSGCRWFYVGHVIRARHAAGID